MLFNYKVLNQSGAEEQGSIDAINTDVAIASLQRRGYIITSIVSAEGGSALTRLLGAFERVSYREVVILSRQVSILFDSHVSALRIFRLLAEGEENPVLQRKLNEIADDIQSGASLSSALAKHPTVFTDFYVNMVKSGEESGKLSEVFTYLADHLERSYELISKTKNALMYPAFVVVAFVAVMILMLTFVIPKLSAILIESGQPIPAYTQVVIGASNFLINYGIYALVLLIIGGFALWKIGLPGVSLGTLKYRIPLIGKLYQKIYLARIADNINTMLSSGVPMLRALEITAKAVDDETYEKIMYDVSEKVKAGSSLSEALNGRPEVPPIMVQMVKVGEETGELSMILRTIAKFYKREADNFIDTLVGLIEPIMIISLAVGVGFLLASILIPIYNVTSSIS